MEQLASLTEVEEQALSEITDSHLIKHLSASIPSMVEMVAKVAQKQGAKGTELYKVIIPKNATLTKSKDMVGAVRGTYRNGSKIAGHANLVKVDPTKLNKASQVSGGVTNVMNVASLVVGQYYMAEVNAKLETLNHGISKIGEFQEREFKSRIMSLLPRVAKITKFSSEILASEELRTRKLQQLDSLEGEATQLLQQVNLAINELSRKNSEISYQRYQ